MLVHSPRLSIASSFGDGPTSVPPACGIKSPRRVWRPVRNVWQNSRLPLSSDINTSSGLPAAAHGRHAWKARCGLTRRKTSGTTACCEEGWYEVHRAQRDAARSMVCDSHPFACKKKLEPQRHFPRDSAALAKAEERRRARLRQPRCPLASARTVATLSMSGDAELSSEEAVAERQAFLRCAGCVVDRQHLCR